MVGSFSPLTRSSAGHARQQFLITKFDYQSRYNQRTMTAMPDMTMATLASRSTKLSDS
jgi:hypothetical protein